MRSSFLSRYQFDPKVFHLIYMQPVNLQKAVSHDTGLRIILKFSHFGIYRHELIIRYDLAPVNPGVPNSGW